MTPDDLIDLKIVNDEFRNLIDVLSKRCDLLESVFKKLMEFDMRLDTLEFNANLPHKPGISEKLATLEYKLNHVIEFLELSTKKEQVNE